MKRLVISLLFVAVTMLGCARNHFNVPTENFAEKVKVLGIAPILVDADSDINHTQKELLLPVISELNRKNEPLLVSKLQGTGNFHAVVLLADEPRQLFNELLSRREKRHDANVEYNKYFWKNDAIAAYIKKNRLDAVMVVTVSGLTKMSKIYASNLLTSLETNYNFLIMTAQIVGSDGTTLWEYPNFRGYISPYYPLVNLQYPDFSESEANKSSTTELRFKSIDGIRRTLEMRKKDLLFRQTEEPEVYGKLFDEMTSLIKYPADNKGKGNQPPPAAEPLKPAATGMTAPPPVPAPAPATVPPVETPVKVPLPKSDLETPLLPPPSTNEIVPATSSTL